jgi:succinate-acetate transporter protein
LENTKISILGGISKFLKLIVFGQILADFGSFGQFWANFAILAVVDSMPKLRLKSLKPRNF